MADVISIDNKCSAVKYLAERDKRLKKVFEIIGPFTYKPYEDGYSFLVYQIIGQMLANKIAKVMRERLVSLCNGDISPSNIDALSDEQIKSIGISQKKVLYIRALTDRIRADSSFLNSLQDLNDEQVMMKLVDIPGTGKWTAKMYLIFVLNRQDVLPVEDYAFIEAFEWVYKKKFTVKEIEAKCKKMETVFFNCRSIHVQNSRWRIVKDRIPFIQVRMYENTKPNNRVQSILQNYNRS